MRADYLVELEKPAFALGDYNRRLAIAPTDSRDVPRGDVLRALKRFDDAMADYRE